MVAYIKTNIAKFRANSLYIFIIRNKVFILSLINCILKIIIIIRTIFFA